MPAYLLDTNICVLLLKSRSAVVEHVRRVGSANCFVSEIAVAELLFGVEKGVEKADNPEEVRRGTDAFLSSLQVLPIGPALRIYATEKRRLQLLGQGIDDFDTLIAATALAHDLTMVTNNTKHFNRFPALSLEDWSDPPIYPYQAQ